MGVLNIAPKQTPFCWFSLTQKYMLSTVCSLILNQKSTNVPWHSVDPVRVIWRGKPYTTPD